MEKKYCVLCELTGETERVQWFFLSSLFKPNSSFFWLVLHQHLCTENSTNTNKSVFDTFSLLLLLLSCLITIIESGVWIEIESKIRNLCNKQKTEDKKSIAKKYAEDRESSKFMMKLLKSQYPTISFEFPLWERFICCFCYDTRLLCSFLSLQFCWECENITILSFSDLYEKIMYEMVNTQFYFISLVSLSIWCEFKWIERLQVDRMFVCGRTSLKLLIFH